MTLELTQEEARIIVAALRADAHRLRRNAPRADPRHAHLAAFDRDRLATSIETQAA